MCIFSVSQGRIRMHAGWLDSKPRALNDTDSYRTPFGNKGLGERVITTTFSTAHVCSWKSPEDGISQRQVFLRVLAGRLASPGSPRTYAGCHPNENMTGRHCIKEAL